MISSMSEQAWLLVYCFLLGTMTGALYDFVFAYRHFAAKNKLRAAVEDILFWCACAVICFLALLRLCYGELRLFTLVGFFVGLIVYTAYISPIVNRVLALLAGFALSAVGFVLRKR